MGACQQALADNPRYSMAMLLREALDAGAPPSMARLPLTVEEVATAYDAAEAKETLLPQRTMSARWTTAAPRRARPLSSQVRRGESDDPRPDTLREPFAWQGAELVPFVLLCAFLSGGRRGTGYGSG